MFCFLLFVCLCLSCKVDRQQLDVQRKLSLAGFLMEDNPDSALAILKGIPASEIKGKEAVKEIEEARKNGYVRARIDKDIIDLFS